MGCEAGGEGTGYSTDPNGRGVIGFACSFSQGARRIGEGVLSECADEVGTWKMIEISNVAFLGKTFTGGRDMDNATVTYSTDGTCLSWVWRESSILWEWKAGHQGGGAVLYIYLELVWRVGVESVCQTGYNCVSVSTYLIGSGFYLGSQN